MKTYVKKVQVPKKYRVVALSPKRSTVSATYKEDKVFGKKVKKSIKLPKGGRPIGASYNQFLNKITIIYIKGSIKKHFKIS